jgi:hypothetical protein
VPVSYGMITHFQEPLEIGRRSGEKTFKLIYVSSCQRTLASVEGVSHVRERCGCGCERPGNGNQLIKI